MYLSLKPYLFIFFAIVASSLLQAQESAKQKEITGHFIIKESWVISPRYADSISQRKSKDQRYINKSKPNILTPTAPSIAVFDRKKSTHFLISPEKFIYYTIPDEFENDSLVLIGISSIYKIDRNTEKITSFSPLSFEQMGDYQVTYKSDDRFQLVKENQNKTKQIAEFNCYQVLLKDTNTNRTVEMYVTDEIRLEFHPIFNVKKYLAQYYPLNIKIYDPEFPQDNYKEYTFYRYK